MLGTKNGFKEIQYPPPPFLHATGHLLVCETPLKAVQQRKRANKQYIICFINHGHKWFFAKNLSDKNVKCLKNIAEKYFGVVMNKKKYCFIGLSGLIIFFLFWGYLGFRKPEPIRVIASLQDDECENEIEVYKEFIPLSTCQLEKQIEERTSSLPLSNIQITRFRRKIFHFDLVAYLDKIQKANLDFSSTYEGENIVTKCEVVLETYNPFTVTMSLDDCHNKHVEPFDLFFVYQQQNAPKSR